MDKETRETFLDIQLSNYVGEQCIFCKHKFNSVEDIKKMSITSAGKNIYNEDIFSCGDCWKHHITQGDVSKQEGVTDGN